MSSSRAWEAAKRTRDREANHRKALETIADLQRYGAEEGYNLPDPDEVADDGQYAVWTDGTTYVQVSGLANLRLTLYAAWEGDGRDGHEPGPNSMFAPKDYDFLPWLARDIVRVLDDHTATLTLGRDYQGKDDHRATVERTAERRRRTRELLGEL